MTPMMDLISKSSTVSLFTYRNWPDEGEPANPVYGIIFKVPKGRYVTLQPPYKIFISLTRGENEWGQPTIKARVSDSKDNDVANWKHITKNITEEEKNSLLKTLYRSAVASAKKKSIFGSEGYFVLKV